MQRHDNSTRMISLCPATMLRILVTSMCVTALTACGETLVYGERTSFNLAIEVNQDPQTPVNVNLGLRRNVVGVVPPVSSTSEGSSESRPSGEAVTMISGFDLSDQDRENPLDPALQIRTQFASGEAAAIVSKNPDVVRAIADADFQRSADFASLKTRNRVARLLSETESLQEQAVIDLAKSPPVADPDADKLIAELDPTNKRATERDVALRMLKTRISYRRDDPQTLTAWEAAVAGAPKQ